MKQRFLAFILASLITCGVFAHPGYEPLFLLDDDASNSANLTADQLFSLALQYSECPLDSERAALCYEKFEAIKKEVRSPDFMSQSPEERGRALLKLLYRDYLSKYNFDQTRLDLALESGVYNCVSSAMLYMAAAKACQLDVRGQKTTQHAFCSIYIPSSKEGQLQKIDVETTNPYGFNPGSREEIENEENIKKFYVVPKKYYTNRQEVSDRFFAGLIAGNICSDCIKNGDYENITGIKSLENACKIAILTRFGEIKTDTYSEFGCHAHEVIKDNQNTLTRYKLEMYTTEVLENIRRIDTVDSVTITDNNDFNYDVDFTVTSINDEKISGSVTI